jgi:1,6-anhydro-N-acetylmuramate kinase
VVAELLLPLAIAGGSTLVNAIATDAWKAARGGIARLFSRSGERRAALVSEWLDKDAEAVEAADEPTRDQLRQQLAATWQTRLADLLAEFPEAAEELKALTAEVRQALPEPQQQYIQNITASAQGATAQGVMFGNIVNHSGNP